MQAKSQVTLRAQQVLLQEAAALQGAASRLGSAWDEAVSLLLACKGRVVFTGIGKSAHIAQKIVATFNSTGTPAIFLHAAEAFHGDLGMVQPQDCVIILSKSGDTPELKVLLPYLRRAAAGIIALVGNPTSFIARQANVVLDASVASEADPYNLAPTTSTTLALALGDALAVCLMEAKGFTPDQFAAYHPGGALGKRLSLLVQDLAHRDAPTVAPHAGLKDIVFAISRGRLGAALVKNATGTLLGIITDGDLRRMLERNEQPGSFTAQDIFTPEPKTISLQAMAYQALQLMEQHHILQLVTLDDAGQAVGLIHLHDILREGIQ